MPGFVGKTKIPVSLTERNEETGKMETNTIYIKDKMGFGARSRVRGSVARNMYQNVDGGIDIDINFGQGNVALLTENIVDWDGPQFIDPKTGKIVSVSPRAIEQLDPEWPLVDMVLKEINERNKAKEDENGKPVSEEQEVKNSEPAGSEFLGVFQPTQREDSTLSLSSSTSTD